MRIYLDYAATTPVDPRVRDAMIPAFDSLFGNPSSIHRFGQEASEAVELARQNVASLLGSDSQNIIFTSGGSEADNAAIKGVGFAMRGRKNHIITSQIEHHAVLHTCRFMESLGFSVTYLPVDSNGLVDPSAVQSAITDKTCLITVMHANNELGTIQPIEEIGQIAHQRGVLFHTDAVQTCGHLPIDVDRMHIDLLSLSAHKFNGPKGVGALYLRHGTPFESFMHGGAQESGRRSSTHNVPGIIGLGRAAEIAAQEMKDENQAIGRLRDRLWEGVRRNTEGIHLNGHPSQRLANNLNFSVENVEGEALLMHLDMEGIAASTGSACSSGSTDPSHVLLALNLPRDLARGSLRLTLGRFTTEEDIDRTIETVRQAIAHLRSLAPARKETT